jgi:hypothetical protein
MQFGVDIEIMRHQHKYEGYDPVFAKRRNNPPKSN